MPVTTTTAAMSVHEACEVVRSNDHGEVVAGPRRLAEARAIIEQACQPPSREEQQRILARQELCADAHRLHRLMYGGLG